MPIIHQFSDANALASRLNDIVVYDAWWGYCPPGPWIVRAAEGPGLSRAGNPHPPLRGPPLPLEGVKKSEKGLD
jgi:hypothetical protein